MLHYHCWNFIYSIAVISFDSLPLPWVSGAKCNPDYSSCQEENGLLQLTAHFVQWSTLLQTSLHFQYRGVIKSYLQEWQGSHEFTQPSFHVKFYLLQEKSYLIYQSVACVKGTLPWSPGAYFCIQSNSCMQRSAAGPVIISYKVRCIWSLVFLSI